MAMSVVSSHWLCCTHVYPVQRESGLPASQIMGLYNRTVRKFVQQLRGLEEAEAAGKLAELAPPPSMEPVQQSVDEDLVCLSLFL